MNKFLLRWALRVALSRKGPERFTISGRGGETYDFFYVRLEVPNEADQHIFVTGFDEMGVLGDAVVRDGDRGECSTPYDRVNQYNFSAERWFGSWSLHYESPMELLLSEFFRRPYIERCSDHVAQLFFNAKTPRRTGRIEILKMLLDQMKSDSETRSGFLNPLYTGVSAHRLLELKHGRRLYRHPMFSERNFDIQMTLDSLVETGDANRVEGGYSATGRAISTIAEYEQENRRQYTLVILTVVIAIAASAQALLPWLQWYSGP